MFVVLHYRHYLNYRLNCNNGRMLHSEVVLLEREITYNMVSVRLFLNIFSMNLLAGASKYRGRCVKHPISFTMIENMHLSRTETPKQRYQTRKKIKMVIVCLRTAHSEPKCWLFSQQLIVTAADLGSLASL